LKSQLNQSESAAQPAQAPQPSELTPADPRKLFVAQWLNQQCTQVQGCVAGVLVLGEPDLGPFIPVASWPVSNTIAVSPGLTDVADRCLQERRPVLVQNGAVFCLAQPVVLNNHVLGLVALECHSVTHNPASLFAALRWGLAGIEAMLLSESIAQTHSTRERMMSLLNLLGTALNEPDFNSAAQAVATEMALQLECDRVSIGFRRKGYSQVVALSHSAQFGERMNLMQAIAQAMDESLDQHLLINMPQSGKELCIVRDHAALARQYGSDAILTIPFLADGQVEGAFVLERSGAHPFDAETIELCQGAVAMVSRVLHLRFGAQQSVWERAVGGVRKQLAALRARGNYVTKLTLATVAVLLLLLIVVPGEHKVSASATVEGAIVRQLIAPFDGYVDSSKHRAGDVVQANDELARLDIRDLHLEYLRWASQADQYDKQYEQHRAEHDRAQSEIAQSQTEQAHAQMDLLADQIQRASIAAPFDGIVVSGDLSQMLGSSVKRGQVLFEISPLHDYRVILEVEESDIDGIKIGQTGQLVLAALPGQTLNLHITRITPLVVAKEGRSFYRVEASLYNAGNAEVRPGMEGVGKIYLGHRALLWIATHKMIDWLRLFAWNWL
jgi:multidrug resistance efflux pump